MPPAAYDRSRCRAQDASRVLPGLVVPCFCNRITTFHVVGWSVGAVSVTSSGLNHSASEFVVCRRGWGGNDPGWVRRQHGSVSIGQL